MDWEAQDDGFLAKIIMDEGAKDVSVGTPVAVVVEEEEHVSCRHQCFFTKTTSIVIITAEAANLQVRY